MSRFLKFLKDKVQQVPIVAKQAQETVTNASKQGTETITNASKQAMTVANASYNQVNSIVNTARSTGRVMKWSIILVSSGIFLYGVARVLEALPKKEKD